MRNKRLLILKESYTSKYDALALEEVNYHDKYKGSRVNIGLFSSSRKTAAPKQCAAQILQ
jgi:hypothetical protein